MLILKPQILLALAAVGASLVSTCWGAIYEHVADLPGLKYDFVIVGGGTAGLVVAERLTENPNFSVLVLEAGVSNEGVIESTIPFLVNELLAPNIYEWNYTTTPQTGLNDRSLAYLRAHMLGGCSSHNLMVYTRGSKDDFDRYAHLTGDPGWSWNRIFPYFLKNEKWTPPADFHDTTGQYNPLVHSTHGMNPVSLNGYAWPVGPRIVTATQQLPHDFPFNLDMNSGKPLGVGWLQSTIGGGKRSSSASSYLAPFISRKNLHVLLHAQVTRLVNPSHTNGKLIFGGVEFVQPGSSPFTAQAAKEIILSAGTVGTPNILMHSGVGSATALNALGIPVLLDLPSVGQNVSDHVSVGLSWSVNSTETLESITQNTTAFNEAFLQWNQTHTGPFVELGITHVGYLRLDPHSEIFQEFPDPSAGPNTAHIEMIFSAGFSRTSPTTPRGHFMNIGTVMVTPISRGTITLNSSNPLDPPLINPQYLTSDFDIFVLRDALNRAQKFVTAPVWKDYIIAPTVNIANFTSDELDQFIRTNAGTISHLVGSAGMSAPSAPYGVVNPDLLVKGAARLSIIDASVLPIVPSAPHTGRNIRYRREGSGPGESEVVLSLDLQRTRVISTITIVCLPMSPPLNLRPYAIMAI
ncbi:GMC oxidoreductase [Mycena sanguinolenta]|uniref:GMC oxidoreductase n=1 Tax=Mycena sanguinolenta TaxID=230812 RepID=A0A8H6XJ77_9AGAR|nr:GMC oxidoreductase [Mycena sanguinolenta]